MKKKVKLKSLKDHFLERDAEHPELGAYINLCYTIHHSGASRNELKKAFLDLIPRDEYDKEEQDELIDYLFKKASETGEDSVKQSSRTSDRLIHSSVEYVK